MNPIDRNYVRVVARQLRADRKAHAAGLLDLLLIESEQLESSQHRDTLGARLMTLAVDHADWSQKTFGLDSDRGPLGALKHLEREASEAQAAPHDSTEYADILLLLLDASRRAGFSIFDLIEAGRAKMAINRERQWPSRSSDDEPTEHVRQAGHAAVVHSGGYPHHVPHHATELAVSEPRDWRFDTSLIEIGGEG